jgi:hypothetical protein
VWIYNGEDPDEEVERRIAAIRQYYKIAGTDIGDRLFVNSGRDTGLKIVVQDGKSTRIVKPEVDQVIAQMLALKIDVLTIDPAVSFHSIPENDNTAMDMFAKEWNYIAGKTNAAIHLLHHVRKGAKGQEYEFTVEDGRGAVALLAAARAARVNNFMSSDEVAQYGIDERDRMNYFRVDGGKPNMAARSDGRSRWYQMVSVNLGNAVGGDPSDDVGVAIKWQPSEAADSVATPTLLEIAARLESGDHGSDSQAKDWAGYVVADVLKLDPVRDKPKIKAMLNPGSGLGR